MILILQHLLLVLCSTPAKRTKKESEKACITLQKESSLSGVECFNQNNKLSTDEQSVKLPSFQEAFGHLRPKVLVGLYQNEMVDTYQWPFCNQPAPDQYDYCPFFDNSLDASLNMVSTIDSSFSQRSSSLENDKIGDGNIFDVSAENVKVQAGNSKDPYYPEMKTCEDTNNNTFYHWNQSSS